MHLRSFFAATVTGAIEHARREMGPEAVIVHSRPAPPEARHLGEHEVVVALLPADGGRSEPATPPDPVARELAQLRRQIEQLRRMIWRSSAAGWNRRVNDEGFDSLAATLAEAEMDPDLCGQVLENVQARLPGGSPGSPDCEEAPAASGGLWPTAAAELADRLPVDPSIGRPGWKPRITGLIGPPGAGKTTTLVKLAVRYGLQCRQPVQLLTLDTYRVAAAEQLRTYAGILGVGFQVIETPRVLEQALQEHRQKDLILIDTPGFGPAELEDARDLAAAFRAHREIDVHLVLAATARSADLLNAVDRFEGFGPSKLLFTRLDEAASIGQLATAVFRSGKPVSFLAAGQRIPEDLEPADKEWMIGRLLEGRWNGLPAAA